MANRDLSAIHVVDAALTVRLVPCRVGSRLTLHVIGLLLVLPDKERNILCVLMRWYHYIVASGRHVH